MITFVAAEIGAGKSCFAAKTACKMLRRGRPVYSNTYIKGCYKFSVSNLENMAFEEHSYIIIDETGNEFNSRSFAKTSLLLIQYFKLSRHFKNDVMLISQTFNDSDKQIRELASKIIFVRPLLKWLIGSVISLPVRVKGKLGIGLSGEIVMQYKIGNLGIPIFLPHWFKYFNSFDVPERKKIPRIFWDFKKTVKLEVSATVESQSVGALALIEKLKNKTNPIIEIVKESDINAIT
jgi:hypothetical protein